MSTIETIRKRLGVTQKDLADAIGCTQSNVGHYIRGMTIPPERALHLVSYARTKGLVLSLDHVYGLLPLPVEVSAAREPAHA
jgi:putative transcriptional regulator